MSEVGPIAWEDDNFDIRFAFFGRTDMETRLRVLEGRRSRLQERLGHYDWVGFYMIEKGRIGEDPMLVLGPYVGAVTQHKRIPLNQGICGAAASTGRTVVIDDVSKDPRYLACSIETKSEIVVPIRVKGEVVGELDIDSHQPAAFGSDDRQLVEHCARLVGQYLERTT